MLITVAADNIVYFIFCMFLEKIRLGILADDSHEMLLSLIFSENNVVCYNLA